MYRRLAVTALAVLTLGAVAMPAVHAAPNGDDPYAACKDGGHVNYIDPATGKPFANQGRCVSTLARGGALVPVTPPVTIEIRNPEYGLSVWMEGQPGTYPVTVTIDGVTVVTLDYVLPETGGGFPYKSDLPPGTHQVVVTVEDQTFTGTVTVAEPSVAVVAARFGPGTLAEGASCSPQVTLRVDDMDEHVIEWRIDGASARRAVFVMVDEDHTVTFAGPDVPWGSTVALLVDDVQLASQESEPGCVWDGEVTP